MRRGLPSAKLAQISTIKAERGARIGRYIVASTTAKYNDPEDIFDVPCDMVFPTNSNEIDARSCGEARQQWLLNIVDAGYSPTTRKPSHL